MNSHLTIKAGSKNLALPADFSIDIDYQNPMFNDAESFSYPAELPIEGNRFLLKNVDDRHSPLRPVDLENTKARIVADGLPIFDGKLKTSDDEELTDALSMNIDGGETLSDLISNLDARDIPVKDDILIGEKIGEVVASVKGTYRVAIFQGNDYASFNLGTQSGNVTFTPQALGFSVPYRCTKDIDGEATKKSSVTESGIARTDDNGNTYVGSYERIIPKKYGETDDLPGETYINVSEPYPTKEYCNAKVSYKHYKVAADGTTDDDNTESNPYMVLDAERPASGICFYVQYFLDCLFSYLGVEWDNSALKEIEDFNRLCFFNTNCGYDEVVVGDTHEYTDFTEVNKWLSSRGCGAQLKLDAGDWGDISAAYIPKNTGYDDTQRGWCVLLDDCFEAGGRFSGIVNGVSYSGVKVQWGSYQTTDWWGNVQLKARLENPSLTGVKVNYCRMYANSDNWPETTVSTIIESLENQFGIRFVYNAEEKKVTAKLLRDMYRSNDAPRQFLGTIHEMNKVSEKITGVRVCYSDESDSKEQKDNLRDQTKDYDTSYDYIDYPSPDSKGQTGMARACTTDISKTYAQICNNASNTDNTCYIDQQTGNAYRVKIDSEATKASEMKPAWFEVGQFKGVELGDCSEANDDYVEEFASDFQPLQLSDANSQLVRAACSSGNNTAITLAQNQPLLVPFCDEDMEHEYVEQQLTYPIVVTKDSGDVISGLDTCILAKLNLLENYDVSGSDDGSSPLQAYDWGLAVAIMRGSGSSATTYAYDDNYDGFGNSKWGQTVGNYALTVDSLDQLGNRYDYNGDEKGVMKGERFSLKIRAFKGELTTWAGDSALCADDYYSATDGWYYIKNRGTFDRFMYEHAYFLINRRKFIIRAEITAAFLQDIRNHWTDRWRINGEIGFINKVSTSIAVDTGIGEVEIEFYAL